ncbi:MAG TPA: hypothetical protein VK927_05980, partial [Adhaeribacter sp.]|nr:hypothetical protein [Adhaeribacter sp.]
MKKIILFSVILFLGTVSSNAQQFEWAKKLENNYFSNQANTPDFYLPPGGRFLAAGTTVIAQTGIFNLNITFGNQTFVSADTLDAYLAAHDLAGNLLWAKQVAGNTPAQPSLVVDHDDNIYISGSFTDSLYIDGLLFRTSTAGKSAIYLIKYDATGNQLWAKSSDLINGNSYDTETDIAMDGAGNIFVAGSFANTLTLDGTTVSANPLNSLFIAKYSANGALQWLRAPTTGAFSVNIEPDAFGNIYILKTRINPTFTYTHILEKIDVYGNVAWSKFFRQFSYLSNNLSLDDAGNPLLSGYYSGSLAFDSDTISATGMACFLAKADAAGNWLWARNIAENVATGYGVNYLYTAPQITYSPISQITVAGVFQGAAQFPGFGSVTNINTNGTFITQLDNSGNLNWINTILNDSAWHNWSSPAGIATDPQGNLYLSGGFVGKAYLDTILLTKVTSEATFLTKITVANQLSVKENRSLVQPFQLYPNPAQNYVMVAAELKKPTAAT